MCSKKRLQNQVKLAIKETVLLGYLVIPKFVSSGQNISHEFNTEARRIDDDTNHLTDVKMKCR